MVIMLKNTWMVISTHEAKNSRLQTMEFLYQGKLGRIFLGTGAASWLANLFSCRLFFNRGTPYTLASCRQ